MLEGKYKPTVSSHEELSESGVKLRKGTDPQSRGYDLLERYRAVPNHTMLLFTSEDTLIERYVREHWAALDGLSGDFCDIHVSLLQLQGMEDAYTQLNEIRSIPGMASFVVSDLPALHIWSTDAWVTLPLAQFDDERKLKDLLRAIFSLIQDADCAITPEHASRLRSLVAKTLEDCFPHATFHQEIYMEAKYKTTGGIVGAMGDNAKAHDFSQVWKDSSAHIDLAALATELGKLRKDMSLEATEPSQFAAMSEVNEAEKAARTGDGPTALEHLKTAGGWIWEVATKVGIGVATAAAKSALGF